MKGLDRLDKPTPEEEGNDASPKKQCAMKNPRVDTNSSCSPAQARKPSADTTSCTVAMDVGADDTRSATQTSAGNVTESRAQKRTPKDK